VRDDLGDERPRLGSAESLFNDAYARLSASFLLTPSSQISSMCSALRLCLSVYLALSPRGMIPLLGSLDFLQRARYAICPVVTRGSGANPWTDVHRAVLAPCLRVSNALRLSIVLAAP